MPYIILIVGLLLGLYGLYRFFLIANMHQLKALGMTAFFLITCAALFFLALSGRLPAALAGLAALSPLLLSWWKHGHAPNEPQDSHATQNRTPLTRAEALDVLGLKDGATRDEINAAYKKLIKKLHPDQEGSAWLAAKLNEARDLLLKE